MARAARCEAAASRRAAPVASVQPPADDDADTRRGMEDRMSFTLRMLLLLIAVIIFVIAAFGVHLGDVSLTALGLAVFAAAFLVPDTALGPRR
jgi:hypothetical protein